MKHVIAFALFLLVGTLLRAQNLSFDETANYIKTKMEATSDCLSRYSDFYKPNETYCVGDISISRYGEVVIKSVARNLYPELKFNINNILKIEQDGDEIRFYRTNSSYFVISTNSQVDTERLQKAFNHLKTVSTKTKDPFDN